MLQQGERHSALEKELSRSRDIYGAWTNREEEWFFTNKRLIFTSKAPEISKQWMDKLKLLVTPE